MSNMYKVKINLDNDPSSNLIFNTIVKNNYEFEVNKVLRKEVVYEKEKRFLLFFKRPSEARTIVYREDVWPCLDEHQELKLQFRNNVTYTLQATLQDGIKSIVKNSDDINDDET